MSKLKSLSKNSLFYGIGQFSTQFSGFLLLPLYTRYLTPDDYGIISTLGVIQFFLGVVLDLRQRGSVLRFYYDYQHDENRLRDFLGTIFILVIVFSWLLTTVLLLAGKSLFDIFLKEIPFSPYVFIVLLTACLDAISGLPLALFRAREQAGKYSIFNVAQFLITICFIIYFVVMLKEGALGKIKGTFCASMLLFFIYCGIMLKQINFKFSKNYVKAALAYGVPLIPAAISTWVIQLSDRLFLAKYSTLAKVGQYSVAYKISTGIEGLTFAIYQAWNPFFFSIAGKKEADRVLPKYSTYYLLFILSIVLIVSVYAKEVLILMTSNEYHSAYNIIPIVGACFIFQTVFLMMVCGIQFVKKTYFVSIINIIGASINIVLNYLLIRKFEMIGAAIATLVTYVFCALITFWISQRLYKIEYEYVRICKIFLLGFIVFIAGFCLNNSLDVGIGTTFVKLSLLLSFPLALVASKFFSPDEVQMAKINIRKLGSYILRR